MQKSVVLITALLALGVCDCKKFSGSLQVDGRTFEPVSCSTGIRGFKFTSVEIASKDGRMLKVDQVDDDVSLTEASGTIKQADHCGHIDVKKHKSVPRDAAQAGTISLTCKGEFEATGTIEFFSCR